MPWLVKTRPHFKRIYACGHLESECACKKSAPNLPKKKEIHLKDKCKSCQ